MRYILVSILFMGFGCASTTPPIPTTIMKELEESDVVVLEKGNPPLEWPVEGELSYKGFGEYFQDRFSGYHVGVDLEAPADTPVYAITDGEVTYSGWVSGYGGVMVVKHELHGRVVSAIYGHLDEDSMRSIGETVGEGEQIAILGEGGTETDGEREHLHLAMYEGEEIRLEGYETESDSIDALSAWLNPVDEIGSTSTAAVRQASDLEYAQGEELFHLDFEIPDGWDIEYIPSIQSLNLYKQQGSGTARQRSQILIRYFDASSFLTLSTVTIYSTEDLTVGVGDYTARRYDIEKHADVADFVDQPWWRNDRHIVTDFRAADGLTRYYVVAANPELDPEVYEELLASMAIK